MEERLQVRCCTDLKHPFSSQGTLRTVFLFSGVQGLQS